MAFHQNDKGGTLGLCVSNWGHAISRWLIDYTNKYNNKLVRLFVCLSDVALKGGAGWWLKYVRVRVRLLPRYSNTFYRILCVQITKYSTHITLYAVMPLLSNLNLWRSYLKLSLIYNSLTHLHENVYLHITGYAGALCIQKQNATLVNVEEKCKNNKEKKRTTTILAH